MALSAEAAVSIAFNAVRLTFLSCYVLLVIYQGDAGVFPIELGRPAGTDCSRCSWTSSL